jgi:hypothetical protein
MELCILRFALPFNLLLPSMKTYFFREAGQLIAIWVQTKQGAVSFSYEKEYTSWIESDDKEEAHHTSSVSPIKKLVHTIKLDRPYADFKGGLVDDVDYSVLSFVFENSGDDFFDDIIPHIAWAVPIIQKFIDNYQLATGRMWLGRVRDSLQSRLVLAGRSKSGYKFEDGNFTGDFQFNHYSGLLPHPKFSGRSLVAPSDKELSVFEARLKDGVVPELHERLLMDAILQAERYQNFDLAIVHSETGFEVFVQRLLIDYCRKNNVQSLPGKKAASVGNQQAIETGNIQNDLFRYIEHCTGFDVKTTTEHAAWLSDAYEPRHAIAHRGARGASEAQAIKALDAINAFMKRLRTLMP